MKELIKNDIIVVIIGCGVLVVVKFGLMEFDVVEKYVGKGFVIVCKLVGILLVLYMGFCVDISCILDLVGVVVNYLDMDMCDFLVVGIVLEWMLEKVVVIGCYVVVFGIDIYLGIMFLIVGFLRVVDILISELKDKVGVIFIVNINLKELVVIIIEDIEKKCVYFEVLVEEKMVEKVEV